jgi:hypothetical protein
MSKEFERDLEALINKHSIENECNTPDFIIARFMTDAYYSFVKAVNRRESWYDREPGIGGTQL